jgi:hypothetical protein
MGWSAATVSVYDRALTADQAPAIRRAIDDEFASPGPCSSPYSPECVEVEFSEVRMQDRA